MHCLQNRFHEYYFNHHYQYTWMLIQECKVYNLDPKYGNPTTRTYNPSTILFVHLRLTIPWPGFCLLDTFRAYIRIQ